MKSKRAGLLALLAVFVYCGSVTAGEPREVQDGVKRLLCTQVQDQLVACLTNRELKQVGKILGMDGTLIVKADVAKLIFQVKSLKRIDDDHLVGTVKLTCPVAGRAEWGKTTGPISYKDNADARATATIDLDVDLKWTDTNGKSNLAVNLSNSQGACSGFTILKSSKEFAVKILDDIGTKWFGTHQKNFEDELNAELKKAANANRLNLFK